MAIEDEEELAIKVKWGWDNIGVEGIAESEQQQMKL